MALRRKFSAKSLRLPHHRALRMKRIKKRKQYIHERHRLHFLQTTDF